jgi:hypothetical protein
MFFFVLLAILVVLLLWVSCLSCISGSEQQLTPATNDISFRDQVIQTDQFFFPAFGPLMVSLSGRRILFVFRCAHFRLPINTIRAKAYQRLEAAKGVDYN